jgi:DNA polymerase-1
MDKKEKSKLFSLFKGMEDELHNQKEKTANSDILLVDGNNTYMRAFSADPSLNMDGEHVGGINGFFHSIGYAIKRIQPTRCIIIFDGHGGSKKRRAIYSEYKNKRRSKVRLNRIYEDLTCKEVEEESILKQMQKVVALCQRLPVTLMAIDNIEADDTIAYLAREAFNNDDTESITIMSSDKDFYQLISDKVKIWSPTKKKMYGPKEIFDEFGISSKNFIFYRILDGDDSDNIDGIKGVGLATAKKVLPMLCEEKFHSLNNIISYIEDHRNEKLKAFQSMADNIGIIKRNYQLMQLRDSDIPNFCKMSILNCLNKKVQPVNPYEFTALLKKYKMLSVFKNHHIWLKEVFDEINFYSKKYLNLFISKQMYICYSV